MTTKDQLRASTSASAYRIMTSADGKTPLPAETAKIVGNLFADHCLKLGLVSRGIVRMSLDSNARAKAESVARRVAWMLDPSKCHGEQATAYAAKTIRALENGTISFEELAERCDKFGSLRKNHIARNNEKKPCAKARSLSLERSEMTAKWLVTGAQIDAVGQKMKNCLANEEYSQGYKSRLRKREIDLIVLEGENGSPKALLSVDLGDKSMLEVNGPSNTRPVQCRDAIIELLETLGFAVGDCWEALNLGICDQLVRASAENRMRTFIIEERTCEVGSGFLAITWDENTFLLRAEDLATTYDVCVVQPDGGSYLAQAEVRVWLRNACRTKLSFARACAAAFEDAPETFRRDWFGA